MNKEIADTIIWIDQHISLDILNNSNAECREKLKALRKMAEMYVAGYDEGYGDGY